MTAICRLGLLALLLAVPALAGAAAGIRERAEEKVRQGVEALKDEDYERSVTLFTEAIKLDPNLASAYTYRGVAYHEQRDFKKALADFTATLRLERDNVFALIMRASTYVELETYDLAIADCNEALRLNPAASDAYFHRGWAYFRKKDYAKALADYDQFLRMIPDDADAYVRRGEAHRRLKNYAKAAADFAKAIEINPKNPEGYDALAWLLATCPDANVRNGQRAVQMARKANELDTLAWGPYADTLAAAYAEAGNFPEAVKWSRTALERKKGFTTEGFKKAEQRLKLFEAGKPYRDEDN
jgi:tetratricopeptide (TPR) repeat protein